MSNGNAKRKINFDYSSPVNSEPNLTGSPERNLLMSILERAILDYVGNEAKEAEQAEDWIFSDLENEHSSPYSFPWVCSELDLDPPKIAEVIKAMPKRGNNRVAPWYFLKHENQAA